MHRYRCTCAQGSLASPAYASSVHRSTYTCAQVYHSFISLCTGLPVPVHRGSIASSVYASPVHRSRRTCAQDLRILRKQCYLCAQVSGASGWACAQGLADLCTRLRRQRPNLCTGVLKQSLDLCTGRKDLCTGQKYLCTGLIFSEACAQV